MRGLKIFLSAWNRKIRGMEMTRAKWLAVAILCMSLGSLPITVGTPHASADPGRDPVQYLNTLHADGIFPANDGSNHDLIVAGDAICADLARGKSTFDEASMVFERSELNSLADAKVVVEAANNYLCPQVVGGQ